MSDTPTLDTLIETLEGIHEHAPGLADRGVWLGENRTTILAALRRLILAEKVLQQIAANKRTDEAPEFSSVALFYNSDDAYFEGCKSGRDEMADLAITALAQPGGAE